MNRDCELIEGPCTCGAWHSAHEIHLELLRLIDESVDIYNRKIRSCSLCSAGYCPACGEKLKIRND